MSIFILSLFFYLRFIIKRSEYSLEGLKKTCSFSYFVLCLFGILLHLTILIIIIYNIFFSKKQKKKHKILIFFNELSQILIWKPLDHLLKTLSPHIPYSGTFIIKYVQFFKKSILRIYIMKSLTIILYFFPRIFMSVLFCIEILVFNKIEFCIKLVWLLIIPFLYIFFINLCEHFFNNNLKDVLEGLEVTPTGLPNPNGVYTNHIFKIKKDSGFSVENLDDLKDNWTLLFYLTNLTEMIRIFIAKYSPFISMFNSILFLVSLSYKFYYIYFF